MQYIPITLNNVFSVIRLVVNHPPLTMNDFCEIVEVILGYYPQVYRGLNSRLNLIPKYFERKKGAIPRAGFGCGCLALTGY